MCVCPLCYQGKQSKWRWFLPPFRDTKKSDYKMNAITISSCPPSPLLPPFSYTSSSFVLFSLCLSAVHIQMYGSAEIYTHMNASQKEISATLKFFFKYKEGISLGNLHQVQVCVCVCEEVGYTECSRKRVANTKKKIELFFHDTSMRSTTCSLISCNHQISFCAVCEGLSAEHNLTPNASA